MAERKKASRLVKQLKRKIEETTDDDERSKLEADLHVAEVDEAYTMHHPHAETYISLYGNAKKDAEGDDDDDDEKKTPAAKAALAAERPPMWKVVEETMKEGPDALRQLRERRSANGEDEETANASQPRSRNQRPQRERMAKVIEKEEHKSGNKPSGEKKTAPTPAAQANGKPGQLNRRERRRIMRETMAEADKDEEGGFFEM